MLKIFKKKEGSSLGFLKIMHKILKKKHKVPLWWDDAYLGPKFDDGELWISHVILNVGGPARLRFLFLNRI